MGPFHSRLKSRAGFTLAEILVGILIVGILTYVLMGLSTQSFQISRNAGLKGVAIELEMKIRSVLQDTQALMKIRAANALLDACLTNAENYPNGTGCTLNTRIPIGFFTAKNEVFYEEIDDNGLSCKLNLPKGDCQWYLQVWVEPVNNLTAPSIRFSYKLEWRDNGNRGRPLYRFKPKEQFIDVPRVTFNSVQTSAQAFLASSGSCPAGQSLVGFDSSAHIICQDIVKDYLVNAGGCPNGEVISGYDSNGNKICVNTVRAFLSGSGSCPSGQMLTGYDVNGQKLCANTSVAALGSTGQCPSGQVLVGYDSNAQRLCTTSTTQAQVCASMPGYTWDGTNCNPPAQASSQGFGSGQSLITPSTDTLDGNNSDGILRVCNNCVQNQTIGLPSSCAGFRWASVSVAGSQAGVSDVSLNRQCTVGVNNTRTTATCDFATNGNSISISYYGQGGNGGVDTLSVVSCHN